MRAGLSHLCCALLVCSACGDDTACEHTSQCPVGSYCAAGECQTDCVPGSSTCAGGVCTAHGRCALNTPDPAAGVCAALVLEAEFGTPTVVLLIDRSGSMSEPYGSDTRWNVLRDALIDPTDGVITNLQSSIRFGLTLYTGRSGDCPSLITVDPALDNRDAIAVAYEGTSPSGETPTGDAIDALVPTLSAYAEPGPKYIVLATDGEPDTCAVPNPSDPQQVGQPEAEAAAQAAFDEGITLFILSVGAGAISQDHLQRMANAGAGTQNAKFYEAGDATQLEAAFDDITGQVLTCELNVNGVINSGAVPSGVIYLDSQRLVHGNADGWEAIDADSFRLLGAACDNAQRAGSHTVTAQFGCQSVDASELSTSGGGAIGRGCSAATAPACLLLFGVALLVLATCRRCKR